MIELRENFFVLTGGPGSGKSTLIDALRRTGLTCVPEAGRRIIRTQKHIGGRALPWLDPALYAELEFGIGLFAFCETDAARITLFDRGLLDPIGFLTVSNLPVPAHMHEAARNYRYNAMVFVAPPWEDIYGRDAERTQSFDLACATHDAMVSVYERANYRLVALPRTGADERVAFILEATGVTPRRARAD